MRSSEQLTTVSAMSANVAIRMGTARRTAATARAADGRRRARRCRPSKAATASTNKTAAVRRRSAGLVRSGPSSAEAYVSGERSSEEGRRKSGETYTSSRRHPTAAAAQRQAVHPRAGRVPAAHAKSSAAAARVNARR